MYLFKSATEDARRTVKKLENEQGLGLPEGFDNLSGNSKQFWLAAVLFCNKALGGRKIGGTQLLTTSHTLAGCTPHDIAIGVTIYTRPEIVEKPEDHLPPNEASRVRRRMADGYAYEPRCGDDWLARTQKKVIKSVTNAVYAFTENTEEGK